MRKDCDEVEGEEVIYLSESEFREHEYVKGNFYRERFLGGFCYLDKKKIIIRESRRGDKKLHCHERKHLEGLEHTWMPGYLMFPSCIGRGWRI